MISAMIIHATLMMACFLKKIHVASVIYLSHIGACTVQHDKPKTGQQYNNCYQTVIIIICFCFSTSPCSWKMLLNTTFFVILYFPFNHLMLSCFLKFPSDFFIITESFFYKQWGELPDCICPTFSYYSLVISREVFL